MVMCAREQRHLPSANAMFELAQSGLLLRGCVPRRTLDSKCRAEPPAVNWRDIPITLNDHWVLCIIPQQ
jgi:hypothetical protein